MAQGAAAKGGIRARAAPQRGLTCCRLWRRPSPAGSHPPHRHLAALVARHQQLAAARRQAAHRVVVAQQRRCRGLQQRRLPAAHELQAQGGRESRGQTTRGGERRSRPLVGQAAAERCLSRCTQVAWQQPGWPPPCRRRRCRAGRRGLWPGSAHARRHAPRSGPPQSPASRRPRP